MTKSKRPSKPPKEPPEPSHGGFDTKHPKRLDNPKAKCPRATRDDVRLLLEACWEQGAWIEIAGNGHFKVYPADGDRRMISLPATPSGYRTIRNKRAQLRREGLDPDFLKKQ